MTEVRYQIFVSSTFSDLKGEREKVLQAILELKAFPAGMELFPAADEEQFEFIKREIDSSDYYVLIIAGRYGSLAPDGVSYTEKEYEYAKSRGKPILAFIYHDIGKLSGDCLERTEIGIKKLAAFRKKAAASRLVNFYLNPDDLKARVFHALTVEIHEKPMRGWIRAGETVQDQYLTEGVNVMPWGEFLSQCDKLVRLLQAAQYKPDLIVGITNGGLIFAEILGRSLFGDVPLLSLWADRYSGHEKWFENAYNVGVVSSINNAFPDGCEILLIDDNVSSSGTFHQALAYIQPRIPLATLSYLPLFTRNPKYVNSVGESHFVWKRPEFANAPIEMKLLHLTSREWLPYRKATGSR